MLSCELLYLIELQGIEQFKQLSVLLLVLQLDVVLLQTMQGELAVVVHVHFHRL
jgi:hypothetical protein